MRLFSARPRHCWAVGFADVYFCEALLSKLEPSPAKLHSTANVPSLVLLQCLVRLTLLATSALTEKNEEARALHLLNVRAMCKVSQVEPLE